MINNTKTISAARKKGGEKNTVAKIPVVWILVMMIFISEIFFLTWCREKCRQVSMEISKEMKNQKELLKQKNKLKAIHAYLKSPERITKIAREKLGLDLPKTDQIKTIP